VATISIDEFADRLYAAAGGKMRDRLQQELIALALNAEGNAKVNATSGPRVRSGMLRRSIAGTVRGTGEALELRLSAGGRTGGGNVEYAALQEYGGTVRPKKKWLTIPTDQAKTRGGDTRGSARMFPDLFFVPIRGDLAALAKRQPGAKRGGKLDVYFWLKKQVTVPATGFMRRAWTTVEPDLMVILQDLLQETVDAGQAP
jgi:hypothetical protein